MSAAGIMNRNAATPARSPAEGGSADRVAVELAYQGPKEHLAEAVDAIARLARDLGLIARTATAQFSPLRADTAQRGAIGWRVKVAMVKPVEAPRAVIRKPENALSL